MITHTTFRSRTTRSRSLSVAAALSLVATLGAVSACSGTASSDESQTQEEMRRGAPTIKVTSDDANVTFTVSYARTATKIQVLIDSDRKAASGFAARSIGADFLIENGVLSRYVGSGGGDWSWEQIKTVSSTSSNGTLVAVVSRADIGSPAAIDVVAATGDPFRISTPVSKDLSTAGGSAGHAGAGGLSGSGGNAGSTASGSAGSTASGSAGSTTSGSAGSTTSGSAGSTASGSADSTASGSAGSTASGSAGSTADGGTTSSGGGNVGAGGAPNGGSASVSVPMPLRPASSFGIACDGATDDTAALNTALAALRSGGGTLVLDPGKTCMISASVRIDGGANFGIDGQGSTLKAVDGTPNAGPLLMFMASRSYVVANLRVDGNRQHRTPVEAWASHNVLVESGSDYSFINVASDNADCDGFIIEASNQADPSTYPVRGLFQDCSASFGFRQGMSVINAKDIRIIGGSYTNTGGTAPEAGIDLEPDPGSASPGVDQVLIRGVTFSGNNGSGVTAGGPVVIAHVTIENSTFDDNAKNPNNPGAAGDRVGMTNSLVQYNTFQHHASTITRGIIDLPYGSDMSGNIIRNNQILNNTTGKSSIYVHGGSGTGNYVLDNVFANNGNVVSVDNQAGGNTCVAGNVTDGGAVDQASGSCGTLPQAGYAP